MLLLLFEIDNDLYALDARQIIEVVPLVQLKKIPNTPDHVAGLMNYRGAGTPVVDLCRLLASKPCENNYSTRIIIVSYPAANKGEMPLALIADNVTETLHTALNGPPASGTLMADSLSLEQPNSDPSKLIQWFDVKKTVPEEDFLSLAGEEPQA